MTHYECDNFYYSKSVEDEIRKRAYDAWLKAGGPAGDGVGFWYEAEAVCMQEFAKLIDGKKND